MSRRHFLIFLLLPILLVDPVHVSAHAELLSADPPPGAQLTSTPTEIRLTFSVPLQSGSTLTVFSLGFQEILGTSVSVFAESPTQLVAVVPTLSPGMYTVQWTSVSADGDELSGSYAFSVMGQEKMPGGVNVWGLVAGILLVGVLVGFTWRHIRFTANLH